MNATGRPSKDGKRQYKCKACNALEGRIRTIKAQSGAAFVRSWEELTPEALEGFMKSSQDLHGGALANAMNLTLEASRTLKSEVHTGKNGKFMPLEYYKEVCGFSDKMCSAIARNCERQYDDDLECDTYCYDVSEKGNRDSEVIEQRAIWQPRKKKRKG